MHSIEQEDPLMHSRRMVAALATLSFVTVAGACKRAPPPPPPESTTTTSAASPAAQRFNTEIERLALARCRRESRCRNIGPNHRYKSVDHCVTTVRSELAEELNAWDCPGGINRSELTKCLTTIQTEDCGNPLDTIGRLIACRSSDLCKER